MKVNKLNLIKDVISMLLAGIAGGIWAFHIAVFTSSPTPTPKKDYCSGESAVNAGNYQLQLVGYRDKQNCGNQSSCGKLGCFPILGGSVYKWGNGILNCKREGKPPKCYDVYCLVTTYDTRNCSGEPLDRTYVLKRGCMPQKNSIVIEGEGGW